MHTGTLRTAYGWTFILNGRYSSGHYRTRAVARQRLAYHKANLTPDYFGKVGGAQ
ncbi:MAG TPA: hypothetical protein VFI41_12795 [Gemmatimonadales bacterium]|nr:hypothetical protein [Gemmatimonadales bacterium]